MMKRKSAPLGTIVRLAGIALLCCWCAAGLAGQQIHVQYDRSVDYRQYRTFAWEPQNLENSPYTITLNFELLARRLRPAVNKELTDRGLALKENPAEADLLISYLVTLQTKSVPAAGDPSSSKKDKKKSNPSNPAELGDFLEGTLILNIHDTATNRCVWQAVGSALLQPELQEDRIRKAVAVFFKKYPPPPPAD